MKPDFQWELSEATFWSFSLSPKLQYTYGIKYDVFIYIYNMEYHSFILIAHIHSMTYIEREGEGCQEAGSTFCDFSKSWSRVTVHVRATKAPWDVPYRYTNLVEYMDMPPTWPSLFFVVSSGSHAHEHRSPISVLHNLSHEIAWGS